MLTVEQLNEYRQTGHVTVPELFPAQQIALVLEDLEAWSAETLAAMSDADRGWFLESAGENPVLRKLDTPAFHRSVFRSLATDSRLVACVPGRPRLPFRSSIRSWTPR